MSLVVYLSLAVLGYALVSRRLSTTPLSGALLFTAAGVLASSRLLGLAEDASVERLLETLLEVTLAVVLFGDAFSVRAWDPARDRTAIRLLAIGMPLTIAMGWLIATWIFPDLGVWEAAALAAILAPTDAALGYAVVSDTRMPTRIRRALNIESGLNDGLSLPFLTIFVILAAETAGAPEVDAIERFLRAIVLSGAIGVLAGWLGGRLGLRAKAAGWTSTEWIRIGFLAVAVAAYALSDQVDGSGFIGAWVAGFVAGKTVGGGLEEPTEFVEDVGSLLMLLAFFTFGAVMVAAVWDVLAWRDAAYAVLSLTVIRMAPVAVSLVGTRLRRPTVAFIGWFGPRGLASLVFVLLVLAEDLPGEETVLAAVTVTVLMSIVLHGVTSVTGVSRYVRWFQRASSETPDLAESQEASEPAARGGRLGVPRDRTRT